MGGAEITLLFADDTKYETYKSFTISMDLTKYCGLIIFTRSSWCSSSVPTSKATSVHVIAKGMADYVYGVGKDGNGRRTNFTELVTMTDTGVTFDGFSSDYGAAAYPIRIYGISNSSVLETDLFDYYINKF